MIKEVVIISDLRESSGGRFAATAHVEARFSCYFHILFTSRPLQNSHVKAFCFRKIFSHGKIKSGRKPLVKKNLSKAVCQFVVLLHSTFCIFFLLLLPRVFSLPLATLFIIVSSPLTLHLAIEIKKKKNKKQKKKRISIGFLFPGNLDL